MHNESPANSFDLELLGFPGLQRDAAAIQLAEVFGISTDAAARYWDSIPLTVKSAAPRDDVAEYVSALVSIGARVRVTALQTGESKTYDPKAKSGQRDAVPEPGQRTEPIPGIGRMPEADPPSGLGESGSQESASGAHDSLSGPYSSPTAPLTSGPFDSPSAPSVSGPFDSPSEPPGATPFSSPAAPPGSNPFGSPAAPSTSGPFDAPSAPSASGPYGSPQPKESGGFGAPYKPAAKSSGSSPIPGSSGSFGAAPSMESAPAGRPGTASGSFGAAPSMGSAPAGRPGTASGSFGAAPSMGSAPAGRPGTASGSYGVASGSHGATSPMGSTGPSRPAPVPGAYVSSKKDPLAEPMPAFVPTSSSGAKAFGLAVKLGVVAVIGLAIFGIVRYAQKPSADEMYATEIERLTAISTGCSDYAKASANSCDSGSMGACYELGVLYYSGEEWVNRNNAHSRRLIQRACDGGSQDACLMIRQEQGPFGPMGM